MIIINTIVIYDSNFGNTKIIAEAIAKELNAKVSNISNISQTDLKNLDLIVVGSPINGWRPTEKMTEFLDQLTKDQLKDVKAAAFDTRVKMFFHGDAAGKISNTLKGAGAIIIADPQGFNVKGKEGPLFDGEVEKAVEWARLIKTYSSK